MSYWSDDHNTAIITWWTGRAAWTTYSGATIPVPYATFRARVVMVAPLGSATSFTEPSDAGYSSQTVNNDSTFWGAPTGGSETDLSAIVFGTAVASFSPVGIVLDFGFTATPARNDWIFLPCSWTVPAGGPIQAPAGQIKLTSK